MTAELIEGLIIPFAGTALDSACVLFMKKELGRNMQRVLTGFASGVMVAASIRSLLIPAMEQSAHLGRFFCPVLPASGRVFCSFSFLTA